jgi:hypothetical protein
MFSLVRGYIIPLLKFAKKSPKVAVYHISTKFSTAVVPRYTGMCIVFSVMYFLWCIFVFFPILYVVHNTGFRRYWFRFVSILAS